MSFKKNWLSFPKSHQLSIATQVGWGLMSPLPLPARRKARIHFFFNVGSRNWTQVIELVGQLLLPSESSPQPWCFSFPIQGLAMLLSLALNSGSSELLARISWVAGTLSAHHSAASIFCFDAIRFYFLHTFLFIFIVLSVYTCAVVRGEIRGQPFSCHLSIWLSGSNSGSQSCLVCWIFLCQLDKS